MKFSGPKRDDEVWLSDLPYGTPIVFAPAVYLFMLIKREFQLLRRQRILAARKLSDDLGMREERVDRGIPLGPGR